METLKKMSKKERKAALLSIAAEVQKICNFDDKPPKKGSEDEIVEWLTEGYQELEPDDKLSEDAVVVFAELGISPVPNKEEKGNNTKTKKEAKTENPSKKEKSEEKSSEKKGITRQGSVLVTIRDKCKKPLSINQIGEFANTLYNKKNKGAKKISKVENMIYVSHYTILPLVEFGVLKSENSKYVLN